jgi:integrase
MKLNPAKLKALSSGVHADGGGLYLVVRETGDRLWAFRFTAPDGKRSQMEFGRLADKNNGDDYTLSGARDKARDYRVDLKDGIDPRAKKRIEMKGGTTFKEFAESQYPDWCKGCNPDEANAWARSIKDMPSLHQLKLHEINTDHILAALKPIWFDKPITADRTRQRLERLFDAAKALKLRTGDNPAAWRGNLKPLLPSARKLNKLKKKGHASVPYQKAPALLTALRYDVGTSARCVEVGILTVARSQEIRRMKWTELDVDARTWRCPAINMKMKKDHLVPLSDQAWAIIQSMPRVGEYVFPSDQADEHAPFYPNALTECIKRAGFKATMHGMRTSFRNWGGDSVEHNFRREVLEHCLSHIEGDEAEKSYWTGDMIERRRIALQAWADYIKPKTKPSTGKKPTLKLVA